VSESGHRCAARKLLEFDHVQEVARGGRATEANIRLRCRAHNQYAAECTFGAGFMREKREAARAACEAQRKAKEAQRLATRAAAEEVITPLRILGFTAAEAKRGAAEGEPGDSLEERIRCALACLRPRSRPPV
jgi:hypothetical protein